MIIIQKDNSGFLNDFFPYPHSFLFQPGITGMESAKLQMKEIFSPAVIN